MPPPPSARGPAARAARVADAGRRAVPRSSRGLRPSDRRAPQRRRPSASHCRRTAASSATAVGAAYNAPDRDTVPLALAPEGVAPTPPVPGCQRDNEECWET
eukprot:1662954-Prymnesium_polylepis.1